MIVLLLLVTVLYAPDRLEHFKNRNGATGKRE